MIFATMRAVFPTGPYRSNQRTKPPQLDEIELFAYFLPITALGSSEMTYVRVEVLLS